MSADAWTVKDAAAEVGVAPGTIHVWVSRGYLSYVGRRGKERLVRLEDVFRAEASRKRKHRRKS